MQFYSANQILNNVRCLCHCYSMFIIIGWHLQFAPFVLCIYFDLSIWFDEQPFSYSARVLIFNFHTFYVAIKFHCHILDRLNFGSHPFEMHSLVFLRHVVSFSYISTTYCVMPSTIEDQNHCVLEF